MCVTQACLLASVIVFLGQQLGQLAWSPLKRLGFPKL